MQEGWGSGGDDANLGASQWEDEDGGVWNNAASQESTSSCSSWGNAPKKGLPKVRAPPQKGEAEAQRGLKASCGKAVSPVSRERGLRFSEGSEHPGGVPGPPGTPSQA